MKSFLFSSFLTLITVFIVNSNEAKAQKLYIKPGIGYSAGVGKTYYSTQNYYSKISQDTTTDSYRNQLAKFSYGKGFNYELMIGSRISDRINIELSLFYHKSKENELKKTESYDIIDAFNIDYKYTFLITGYSYGVKPNLLYYFNNNSFRPYAKVGASIAFNSLKENINIDLYNTIPGYKPIENIQYKSKYEKEICLGFHLGGGFEITMLQNLFFFTEIYYLQLNYSPKNAEITEYIVNGENTLNDLTTNERYLEFVESYSSNDNLNDNTPYKKLKTKESFSQLGFLLGFKFHLCD